MDQLLVVGALGLVGRAVLRHFESMPQWRLTGLSRRQPDFPTRCEMLSVDLRDPGACEAAAGSLSGVTHIVYCANSEETSLLSGWLQKDHVETNVAMLRNLMEPLRTSARGLRHVTLLQGRRRTGRRRGRSRSLRRRMIRAP